VGNGDAIVRHIDRPVGHVQESVVVRDGNDAGLLIGSIAEQTQHVSGA
jgi:hypothetical protein